jgi:hypothetical protein
VLVKGWKASSNWGFPKGKINETEPPASCAIREVSLYFLSLILSIIQYILQVLEETGYNLAGQLDPANVIELTIKEQKISLFIVHAIPEDFNFQTKTRKEISVWNLLVYLYRRSFTYHYVFSKFHGSNYRTCQRGRGNPRCQMGSST